MASDLGGSAGRRRTSLDGRRRRRARARNPAGQKSVEHNDSLEDQASWILNLQPEIPYFSLLEK